MGCSCMCRQGLLVRTQDPRVLGCQCKSLRADALLGEECRPSTLFAPPLYKGAAPCKCSVGGPLCPVGVYLHCNVRLSLPPSTPHGGESAGSDGTLTRCSSGVKTIAEHGANSYVCAFDKNCTSTMPAVFVPSLSTTPNTRGNKPGRASSCHRPPVLETAHLASLLVRPAGSVEAEASPSPNTVPWHIDLCQLGSGKSSSTSNPDQTVLRLEGFKPSLPHLWPAATTVER